MKRLLRWAALALIVLLIAAGGVVGWGWWRSQATPNYWRVVDASDPAVERDAEAFERWISNRITAVRDEPTWTIEVEAEDVNRWLATRLPRWLENQQQVDLPAWVSAPMVAVEDGRLIIAAEAQVAGEPRVISLAYRPVAGDSGIMELHAEHMAIGRLWMPADLPIDRLAEALGNLSDADRAQLAKTREQLQTLRLRLDLGDGRVTSVRTLELSDSGFRARCRTHFNPPEPGARAGKK